ncbi:hypothetical protein Leryth_006216 [Lithospermum erythrorhizon]|uniref:AN1-type domain-containing protein n=1 Tax=Lithospermum erythrorhizon TaxID=34254 RepID=A0AAV3PML9_LITER|nr:hypothetical protein Leryth_006216 [Lithospermum erythrorhizon]
MAQQRGKKEDTDLKVPETLSTFSTCPNNSLQLSRPSQKDCPLSTDQSRSTSTNSNPIISPKNSLKRPRDKEVLRCSCSGCKKKLGLMGFRCRCGEMFCPEHRYSDRHDCGFDYKAAGKEAIARENPVIRAVKLVKV